MDSGDVGARYAVGVRTLDPGVPAELVMDNILEKLKLLNYEVKNHNNVVHI